MKHILIIFLALAFLPFVFLALWVVFYKPGMLDAEDDYPVLDDNQVKGAMRL